MILIQVRLLRLAAKTWHKDMPEVAKLFSQFKVYDFMQDMTKSSMCRGIRQTSMKSRLTLEIKGFSYE